MKVCLEVINYESDQNNFMVKIKVGTQVLQTILGNTWNQRFTIENKRGNEIKVEIWQKTSNFQFIGDAVVPKIEALHKLDILNKGKKEGVLNVIYKDVPKDNITQSEILQQDAEQMHRLEKPQKLIEKLNQTFSNTHQYDYSSLSEYFVKSWQDTTLSYQAKQQASYLVKESLDRVISNVQINPHSYHIEDNEQTLSQVEQQNIGKLQKELIKNDLQKYERNRREVTVQILDLDELNNKLRIDQVDQRTKVAGLRKELTQKLLYLEDKIEHLKRILRSTKHHVFATNSNLPNSQIEMSQISIQKEFIAKWESDPKYDEIRQEFVKKQMKEWNELQEKRRLKIEEQELKIKQEEEKIKEQQKQIKESKNSEKKQQIEQHLKELQEKQQKRIQDLQEQNKRYEEKKKEQYLALKYAQDDALYLQRLQEERKSKLEKMKNPDFDIEDIKIFEQKLKEIHQKKAEDRIKKIQDREAQWNRFKAQYYSDSYRKAKEQLKQAIDPNEEQKRIIKERMESQRIYNYDVRQKFKPAISQEKSQEMENLIRGLRNVEPNFKAYRDISEKPKKKRIYFGIEKKETAKKIKLKPLEQIPTPISPRKIGEFYLRENGTYNKKHIPPLQKPPKPPGSSHSEKKMDKVTDFLKEQRLKKAQLEAQQQVKEKKDQSLEFEDYKIVNQIKKKLEKLEKGENH